MAFAQEPVAPEGYVPVTSSRRMMRSDIHMNPRLSDPTAFQGPYVDRGVVYENYADYLFMMAERYDYSSRSRKRRGIIGLGMGAATFVGSGLFFALADRGADGYHDFRYIIGGAMILTGATAFTTGGTMFLLGARSAKRKANAYYDAYRYHTGTSPQVSLTPSLVGGGTGASLSLRF